MPLLQTLDQSWDAIVIGAGPAGAVSAFRLARAGWHVLLLERCAWPRPKVCGGCVNADAVRRLRSLDISLPQSAALHTCVIQFSHRSVHVPLPGGGVAIKREDLDPHLVAQAQTAGAVFVDRVSAHILPQNHGRRSISIERDGVQKTIFARWVLACDGINGSSLAGESWAGWSIHVQSKIGIATSIRNDDLPAGEIHMTVGDGAYVGQVRIDAQRVHVAAAIDPAACRMAGSPGQIAAGILDRPQMTEQRWSGIGRLTRHRKQRAAPGVLAVGDACGYVEPFTGQGIAWAIAGAIEATSLLLASDDDAETAARWNQRYLQTVGRSQRLCHAVRYSLRHPIVGSAAMAALSLWPAAWGALSGTAHARTLA